MSKVKKGLLIALGVIVVGGSGGAGFYFYREYQHARTLLKDPAAAAQEEAKTLMDKVASHIQLPTDENPTIATISDPSQLTGNSFFAQAKKGDVVMIFIKAKKAILFRPSINKIIEVAPVNTEPNTAGASTSSAQLQSVTLAIYNSTSIAGLASVAEGKLKTQIGQIQTTVKANSRKDNYPKTMVIILNQEAQSLGAKLGEMLNADVSAVVPAGETKPNTDLLLILGEDFKQ